MNKTQLRQLKSATEKLTRWESSGKAFGHFKVIEKKATTTKGADRIYEFFCLMKVLDDLRSKYDIKLEPGTITNRIFPEAPAPKKGWPYFLVQQKVGRPNKFQICYGTEIKLSSAPKTTIAPDISVQNYDSTDDPDESMVNLIMDAKFKYRQTDALPVEQIHAFIQRVNALQTQKANSISLHFNTLTNLKSNCLLTNGRGLKDQHQYCVNSNIKQVEKFDSAGTTFHVIG